MSSELGNDGLTDEQRAESAQRARDTTWRKLTPEEADALRSWRERRRAEQEEWLAEARAQAEALDLRNENLNDEPDAWFWDYFEGDVEVYKNDPA